MKKSMALILTIVMALSLFSGCKASKTDWEYIEDKGSMIIGITYFAPMNYKDDSGNLIGFETEFAEAVCAELGVKAQFQDIDWNSKETELQSKNIDCIWNGMTIDEDRKSKMDISTPYMKNKQVMVVKSENVDKYSDSANIEGATVVAEQGSAGENVATKEAAFDKAEYTAVDAQSKVLLEISSGTAEIGIVDYVMSIGSIGEGTDYNGLAVTPQSFADEEYGIAFRKDSPETLAKVNAAIQKLASNGTLKTIADKYKLGDLLLLK